MKKNHDAIISQVPPDYYQEGVRTNIFQRIWHKRKLAAVLDFISDDPANVLDVGCASGWFTSEVSKRFPNATYNGVDVHKKALAYGKTLYPHIRFKTANAEKLPYEDKTFDLVICTETLEHVQSPKETLREIHRVLTKSGKAIIELDSGSNLFSIVWFLWKKSRGKVWNDSHLHAFSVKKLEKQMKDEGFVIEKKRTFSLGMGMIFLITKNEV